MEIHYVFLEVKPRRLKNYLKEFVFQIDKS